MSHNYQDDLTALITTGFIPAGFDITQNIKVDPVLENATYSALTFGLNGHRVVFRKAKVTPDRPGAFLSIWQRPSPNLVANNSDNSLTDFNEKSSSTISNKPIPLTATQLDYLFIQVQSYSAKPDPNDHTKVLSLESTDKIERGMFIFPVSLLLKKGIVCGDKSKGKNGFRVFPPWSQDRGTVGTQIFSASGKQTQRWQLPYFVNIDENGVMDSVKLKALISQ